METKGLASDVILALGRASTSLAVNEIHKAMPTSLHVNETALTINGLKLTGRIEVVKPKKYALTDDGWIEFNRLNKAAGSTHKKPKMVVRAPKTENEKAKEVAVPNLPVTEKIEALPKNLAEAFDAMSKARAPAENSEIKILVLDRLKDFVAPDVADVLESIKRDLRARAFSEVA